MKKPLKWSLVILGVIVALPVVIWLDAIRRAVNVIDEEERRLPEKIAKERARKTCDEVLRRLNAAPPPKVCYEQSWLERCAMMPPYWSVAKPQERISETVLVDLARTTDAMREAGATGMRILVTREHLLFEHYKKWLSSPQPGPGELRRSHEALGAIRALRPMPADFARSEEIQQKTELLRVLRRKEDPAGFVLTPPCWRELYSWRILIAKSLNQCSEIEEITQLMLAASPPTLIEQASVEDNRWGRRDLHFVSWFQYFLLDGGEYVNRTDWVMAQTATAIRLFQAEKGRDPERLQDLVPEYLQEVPSLSSDGKPLSLHSHFGRTWEPGTNPMEAWPVLRK